MYDPSTVRFLSKDPLEAAGGSPNLYLYCANDPVNKTDPSGRYLIADDAALGPWLRGLQMAGVDAQSVPLSGAALWNQRHYIDVPKTDEQRQKLKALVQRWYGRYGASYVDHVYGWIASGEIGHVDAIGEGITHRSTSELADGWIEEILKFSYARQGIAVNYTTEKFGLLKEILSAFDCVRAAGGVAANLADLATGIPAGLKATGEAAFSGAIDEVFGNGRWSQSLLGAVLDWAHVDRGWAQLIDSPNRDQVLTAVFRQLGFTADALFGKAQSALGGNVTTLLWAATSLDGALGGATDVDAVSERAAKWALDLGRTVEGFEGVFRQAIDELLRIGKDQILDPVVEKMYTQFFIGAVTRAIPVVGWVFGLIKGLVGAIRVLGNLCGLVESLRNILNDWLEGRAGQQQLQAAMVKLLRDGLKTLVQFVAHQINLGGVPAIIQKGLEGVKAAAMKPVDKALQYVGRAWDRGFGLTLQQSGLGQHEKALTNPVQKAGDGRTYRLWVDRTTRHPILKYNPTVDLHDAVKQAGAGSCLTELKGPAADVEQRGHKLASTLSGPPKLTAAAARTVPHENSALVGGQQKLVDAAANCGVCALPGGAPSPIAQGVPPAAPVTPIAVCESKCEEAKKHKDTYSSKAALTVRGREGRQYKAVVDLAIPKHAKEVGVCRVWSIDGPIVATDSEDSDAVRTRMRKLLTDGTPWEGRDNSQAGHLIASELGGPNTVENLVPMNARLNNNQPGLWRKMEMWARRCLEKTTTPADPTACPLESLITQAQMSVKVSYDETAKGFAQFIPTAFTASILYSTAQQRVSGLHTFKFNNGMTSATGTPTAPSADVDWAEVWANMSLPSGVSARPMSCLQRRK